MNNMVKAEFEGVFVNFNSDGWVHVTDIAAKFNKRAVDWLALESTKEYIEALCEEYEVSQNHFIKTRKGKGVGGTWLHPDLMVAFGRWLDVRFAVWCDRQIKHILHGEFEKVDWFANRARSKESNGFMGESIKDTKQALTGKAATRWDFVNENDLVRYAYTGQYKKEKGDTRDDNWILDFRIDSIIN